MRAKAVATISFGLVDIPVRVYAAVESKSKIEFRLLHAKCNSQLKQQHACPTCEKPVDRADQVRGYEFAKGRFVTFDAAELEQVGELEDKPATQAIAVDYFVPLTALADVVPSAYLERCDFVGPDDGSERPFAALVKALNAKASVAVAKYSSRGRTHLVVLAPVHGDRLQMLQLRAGEEVRSIDDVPMFQEAAPAAETVRLTELLIEQMTRPAIAVEHVDEARQRLAEQIQQKIDAGDVVAAPSASRAKPIADLESALKASITKPAKKGAPASSG
jgi:DNA end-binding protein Ku